MPKVETTETHKPGKATLYRVCVCRYDNGGKQVTMQREFRGLRNKKRADEYAAWLEHLLMLEAAAAARRGRVDDTKQECKRCHTETVSTPASCGGETRERASG